MPPLLREFAPEVLVTQHGCDSHIEDPLAHLMLTVDGQRAAYLALHDLAHEVAGGRWVATGGGGYALVDVVPRAWTHLLAIVGGRPLDPATATPGAWREHVRDRAGPGRAAPAHRRPDAGVPRLGEGYDPDTWLDRAIHAHPEAVFPLHGLDPLPVSRSAAVRLAPSASRHAESQRVTLVNPFPTSHIRLYSHRARRVRSPVGKPVACREESRCTMATNSPGTSPRRSS